MNNNSSQLNIDTSSSGVNAKIIQCRNVDQTHITITEDKVKLILIDHLEKIVAKRSWETPLGIFSSLMLVLISTEKFKSFSFIPADFWEPIIDLGIIGSFIWLMRRIFKIWLNRKNSSIDGIINVMKNS